MTGGEGDKPVHTRHEQWSRCDEECLHALLNEHLEGHVDLGVGAGIEYDQSTADRACGLLCGSKVIIAQTRFATHTPGASA